MKHFSQKCISQKFNACVATLYGKYWIGLSIYNKNQVIVVFASNLMFIKIIEQYN